MPVREREEVEAMLRHLDRQRRVALDPLPEESLRGPARLTGRRRLAPDSVSREDSLDVAAWEPDRFFDIGVALEYNDTASTRDGSESIRAEVCMRSSRQCGRFVSTVMAMAVLGVLGAACVADPIPEGELDDGDQNEEVGEAEQSLYNECLECGNGDYCDGLYLKTGTKVCAPGGGCSCRWTTKSFCPKGCHRSVCHQDDYCN